MNSITIITRQVISEILADNLRFCKFGNREEYILKTRHLA